LIHILDTKVISALRRADRAPRGAGWRAGQVEDDLYLRVITLGEIERGIRLQEPRKPGFAADLQRWLARTASVFAGRWLALTRRMPWSGAGCLHKWGMAVAT